MNKKQIQAIHAVSNKLAALAMQYRSLQNPACIHFEEVMQEVNRFIEINPATVDNGSSVSLTALHAELNRTLAPHGSSLITLQYSLGRDEKPYVARIARLFPAPGERYSPMEEYMIDGTHTGLLAKVAEWINTHAKEAAEKGIDSPEVVADLTTEPEPVTTT